ncbi:hypothetical protein P5640_25665 [Bacillus subtilis]
MVPRESIYGLFYGCSRYPKCGGIRKYEEGFGKITGSSYTGRRCRKCGGYDDLSDMGLCRGCQEDFDND